MAARNPASVSQLTGVAARYRRVTAAEGRSGEISLRHGRYAVSLGKPWRSANPGMLGTMVIARVSSSGDQSVEVPSKDPAGAMSWDEPSWRSRYEEKETLDEGGYGVVLRVVDRTSGEEFALKRPVRDEPEVRARFEREIKFPRRIKHKHVMQIVDFAADFSWFTMPLARHSLRSAAPKGIFPCEIAAIIGRVAAGLHAAHEKKIVHRDVKPSNILLLGDLSDGNWVVADFGLLQPPPGESGALKSGRAVGTRGYMAPETIVDPGRVGPAADVYSLGRTLGWLTTGMVPVDLERLEAPEPWTEIVARMTALDPRDRIRTMTEVVAELGGILTRLREREAARWAKPFRRGLGGDDERLLATIIDRAREPSRNGGNMYVTSDDLRDVSIPRPVLLVSLKRLVELGYLATTELQIEFGSMIAHCLMQPAWSWADENRDRLPALVSPRPPPPEPSDIPF